MKVKNLFENLKQYVIKSNTDMSKCRYEIHKPGCKHIQKNSPGQIYKVAGKSAEDVIKNDMGTDNVCELSDYKIMNCCKGY